MRALTNIDSGTDADEVLTADEAADYLKVSTKTILRRARAGDIPGAKIGHVWRFSRSELRDLLAATT